MESVAQFWRVARAMMEQIADKRARRKTGVIPGGPYGSVYVDDSGHVYATGAGGMTLKALYTGSATAATLSLPLADQVERVQWNTMVYDPLSLVTTGASWVFTAPSPGYYFVVATSGTTTELWYDGDTIVLSPVPVSGFFDQWKAPLPQGSSDSHLGLFLLQTAGVIYRNAGETIYFTHDITCSHPSGTLSHGGQMIAIYG